MTADERDALQIFLRQVLQRSAVAKDPVAHNLIQQACAHHPDALYLLVQKALGCHLALQAALARNTELQSQLGLSGARSMPSAEVAVDSPVKTAPPAVSLWGAGMLGVLAGTAVGVVAGSWLLPDIDALTDILPSSSAWTDDLVDLDGDHWV
ncbi:MAG: hypothetical protein RJB47_1846 [Pseudomonadota bacterium]|jgi:hypothetical protein